jgi:hypothetical protein
VRFSAPQSVPGVPAETQRALLDAFQAIQQELVRLSAPFTRVPLLDDVQETRDGQVVRGVGDGNTLVLPGPPAFYGVRVVLDDVSSPVTVVAPDATEYTLPVAGVYDFLPASDGGETYETTPLLFSLLNVTSGVVLGRETAGTGPVEELSVGGGLELSSGLQIADLGVTTAKLADAAVTFPKLVDAPSAGFIGATAAGDYAHRTVAQAAAAFASTSIVVSGDELQRAAVSGDVSIPQNSNTATIPAGTVDNSQTADMAEARVKGRPDGAGTGPQQDMTPAQTAAIVGPELPGRLIAVTAYATAGSGTHTFDSDATSAEVWVIGGGGGGGGAVIGVAAGGGAGALNYAYVAAGSLPSSASYTVGAGGSAGSAVPAAGGAGAASTVTISASVHSAGGGAGGGSSAASAAPGAGGAATAGTFTVFSVRGGAGSPGAVAGGNGGDSAYGGGGLGPNGLANGVAGVSGGGGSGAVTVGVGRSGGAGGAGLIIVKEYA